MTTPTEKAALAFNEYAAMDAPDLPSGFVDMSKLQVRLYRWQVKHFDNQDSWRLFVGAVEEMGELARAILKNAQKIRGFDDKQKFLEASGDAIADIIVYLTQLATNLRLDIGQLFYETAKVVMERDWTKHPKDADKHAPDAVKQAFGTALDNLFTSWGEELSESPEHKSPDRAGGVKLDKEGAYRTWMEVNGVLFNEDFDAHEKDEHDIDELALSVGLSKIPLAEDPADYLNKFVHLVLLSNPNDEEEDEDEGCACDCGKDENESPPTIVELNTLITDERILGLWRDRGLHRQMTNVDYGTTRAELHNRTRFSWIGNADDGYWVKVQLQYDNEGTSSWGYRVYKDEKLVRYNKPTEYRGPTDTMNHGASFSEPGHAMESGISAAQKNCINHSIKIDTNVKGPLRPVIRPSSLEWNLL
jgi:NTP pyrophosphatase (non-canonical NTP hydrolase)